MRWLALACLVLMGCSQEPVENVKAAKRVAREEVAERALSVTPPIRTYRYELGQLLVLEIPFKDSDGFLETHRCVIWKDYEFKAASISCPAGGGDALPDIN